MKQSLAILLSAFIMTSNFAGLQVKATDSSSVEDSAYNEDSSEAGSSEESGEPAEGTETGEPSEEAGEGSSDNSGEGASDNSGEGSSEAGEGESSDSEKKDDENSSESNSENSDSESSDSESSETSDEASTESTDASDDASTESTDASDEASTEEALNPEENPELLKDTAGDGDFFYEEDVDGYHITLSAKAGVLPEDTTVQIEQVTEVAGQNTDELVNDVLEDNEAVFSSAAFNITLFSNGVEIQPEEGTVDVNIVLADELTEGNVKKDDTELQVFHIDDEAVATEVPEATTFEEMGDTVVSYDADSFSVYEVARVLQFDVSDTEYTINDFYSDIVEEEEVQALGADVDTTEEVKTLLSQNGKCTNIQEIGEAVRAGIKNRQQVIAVNFAIKGRLGESALADKVLNIAYEHTGVPNEGDYVKWASIMKASKSAIGYANKCTYGTFKISFVYTHNYAQEVQTTNAVNNIIKASGASAKGLSDFNKISKIYKYIVDNINYDHNYQAKDNARNYTHYSCYSAAVLHSTVCEGFALLFYRCMLQLGVDARLISGKGNGESHGWNIVKLGGVYYNLDSTWDSGQRESDASAKKYSPYTFYFLKGAGAGGEINNALRYNGTVVSKYYGAQTTFDSTHIRDYACNNPEFNAAHPMSTANYYGKAITTVNATGIKISQTSATLNYGQSLQISATLSPANCSQGIRWSSGDSSVATVNESGLVTGVSEGEVNITATSVYGGVKAVCRVRVTNNGIYKIEFEGKKITTYVDSTYQLNPVIYPYWGNRSTLKYSSDNKSIATVNKKGIVKGKRAGTCKITVKSKDGAKATIKVKVKPAKRVKSVKLNAKKVTLAVGAKYLLSAKIKPTKATNKAVKWKSSKKNVASVDSNGMVTAISPGTTTITVVTKDGKKKAKCKVTVQ